MKMNEIFIQKCVFINDYNVKMMKIYCIKEACMIMNIFSMHRSIFVGIRLVLGSQLTCQPDQESRTADCIFFRF